MKHRLAIVVSLLAFTVVAYVTLPPVAIAQENAGAKVKPTLQQLKVAGALQSSYRSHSPPSDDIKIPQADLETFHAHIKPLLQSACFECHSAKNAEGEFRIDTLDPDLVKGEDVDWWLEVSAAVTNGEMPPEDGPKLIDTDRKRIIEWLSGEVQSASQVRTAGSDHSSFRRMTRYEYNYALQDLLGLPLNFAEDLPPDPQSEHGFKNSSEMLQMSAKQYADYMQINRHALKRATVRGKRPEVLYWGITARRASERRFAQLAKTTRQSDQQSPPEQTQATSDEPYQPQGKQDQQERERGDRRGGRGGRGRRDGRNRGRGAHYKNLETGETATATWTFRRAVDALAPTSTAPEVAEPDEYIAILPKGEQIILDLGNRLPDEGTLRVRVRASRVAAQTDRIPSMALEFGWQGSNNSKASVRISDQDLLIDAAPGTPQFYQWEIPLSEIYPRNPVRQTVELGAAKLTNPSEYIRLNNTSLGQSSDIQFDYVEVSAPVYEQWPPDSHSRIFIDSDQRDDETVYAREVITQFMKRAWRRNVNEEEVDLKMAYFARIRPNCEDFQEAMVEVLATVLSSPRFLYLVQSDRVQGDTERTLDSFELATRLSVFLWCSIPDDELLNLAENGKLCEDEELVRQMKRMLADPRHRRFSKHFVRQWLDMDLLDYLTVDRSTYPQFDSDLMQAMQQEPIAFFEEVLQTNASIIDFIHADYSMVNERLALHYGIEKVQGPRFRRVSLASESLASESLASESLQAVNVRGGLLTQAGLLAMNSDGKDSHPLKRSIWLLESILNDPPPPPPPAVPEIDLADPEILKLTLKERMEDHRNKPACYSCHVKIDPWGIAFENFNAIGSWRTKTHGKEIDASSLLYNQHQLDGVDGLKRYLLSNRQDQFARAMVHKLTTYALGRPLTFSDRAEVERLTAKLRNDGDGLQTLIQLLIASDLFQKS